MQRCTDSGNQGVQRFHFDALVRGLCESTDMIDHVQDITVAACDKQKHATAAIEKAVQAAETEPLHDSTNIIR